MYLCLDRKSNTFYVNYFRLIPSCDLLNLFIVKKDSVKFTVMIKSQNKFGEIRSFWTCQPRKLIPRKFLSLTFFVFGAKRNCKNFRNLLSSENLEIF